MEYGRPAICPRCLPKNYFGTLLGYKLPKHSVRIRKQDVCLNCETQLVEPKLKQ
jgi:hypothetical protein